MTGKTTKVIHLALDPVTGPWSVMRELALAQLKQQLKLQGLVLLSQYLSKYHELLF